MPSEPTSLVHGSAVPDDAVPEDAAQPGDAVRPGTVLPPPRDPARPYHVCFVCLGNICRSPAAEVVAREALAKAGLGDAVVVDSAGTGDWHVGEAMNSGSRDALARRGYDGDAHRARQFDPSWHPDLILAMDKSNVKNVKSLYRTPRGLSSPPIAISSQPAGGSRTTADSRASVDPGVTAGSRAIDDAGRVRLFGEVAGLRGAEVPDPYGGPAADFDHVVDMLEQAMPSLITQLATLLRH